MVRCRLFGHRYRFAVDGTEMTWTCVRCAAPGGAKRYDTAEDAERYAEAFNKEDTDDLGRRAPLIGLLPLRIYRWLRR